ISLAAAVQMLARLPDRRDVVRWRLRGRGGAECRPLLHQSAPLLEHVTAPIGLLHLPADDMCEGRFDYLVLKTSAFARPRLECRAEAVRRQVATLHPAQQHQKRHVGKRLAELATRKHEATIAGAVSLHFFENGKRARGKRDAMLPPRF